MKTIRISPVASLSVAALLASALAHAQQPTDSGKSNTQQPQQQQAQDQKKKGDQPPKLEKLEDSEPPSIKVGKPEQQHKITETRDDSGVKEVKVQTGVSTYYVRPNQQVGNSLPGDVQSVHNTGAEFKVFEFDLGGKGKKSEKDESSAVPPKDSSVSDEPPKK